MTEARRRQNRAHAFGAFAHRINSVEEALGEIVETAEIHEQTIAGSENEKAACRSIAAFARAARVSMKRASEKAAALVPKPEEPASHTPISEN